jgi:integrase
MFSWAKTNMLVRANPAAGVSAAIKKRGKAAEERDPLSDGQLRTLFEAPLYAGCRSRGRRLDPGTEIIKDHYYWLSPATLASGLRTSELGQLPVSGIIETEHGPHFHVTASCEPGEEAGARQLKSAAAKRKVPVHPLLIELGFLEYVEEMRAAGHARVFPHWKRGADGYYSSPMSKWASRMLARLKIKTQTTSIYSLRHNFKDALRDAALIPVAQDLLMGHASEQVQARYGSGQLRPREIEIFNSVRFPVLEAMVRRSQQQRSGAV